MVAKPYIFNIKETSEQRPNATSFRAQHVAVRTHDNFGHMRRLNAAVSNNEEATKVGCNIGRRVFPIFKISITFSFPDLFEIEKSTHCRTERGIHYISNHSDTLAGITN